MPASNACKDIDLQHETLICVYCRGAGVILQSSQRYLRSVLSIKLLLREVIRARLVAFILAGEDEFASSITRMPRDRETYSYVEEWRRRWEPELEAIAYNGATCDPTRVDPKVLHWVKKQRLDKKPHFVQIINANAAKGRPGLLLKNACSLSVPSPFVRQHYRQLERVVTLETTTASNPTSNEGGGGVRKWRVSFGAPKRDPHWLQGWQRVAEDNNFHVGDVVVFVLVEPSRFHFTHFDADGNLSKLSVPRGKSKLEAGRCSSQESHDNEAQLRDDDATKKTKKNSKRPLVELANGPTPTTVSNLLDSTNEKTKKRAVVELVMGPISTVSNVEDATQEMKKRALVERANGSTSTMGDLEDAMKETKKNRALVELANGPMSTAGDEQVAPPAAVPIPAGKSMAETSSKERRKQGKPNSEEPNHDGDNIVAVRNIVDRSFDPLGFAIKSQRRVTTVVEKEQAKHAAMAQAQALTDPHFVTVLSDSHVYHDFHLVVPENFAVEAGWATSTATRVKLEDGQGECWDLLVKKNKYHEVAFHRKLWALFSLHHLLEEGDVCVFHRTRPSSPRTCKCSQQQIEHVGVQLVRVVPLAAHPLPLLHHYALQRLRHITSAN